MQFKDILKIVNFLKHQFLSVILIFSITILKSQEISVPKFGKGILQLKGQEDTWSMNLSFRMQLLTMADFEDNQINNSSYNSLIRRSRIKMSGFAINPKLKYKFELGLSNRDISGANEFTSNSPRYILDAYVDWNFYKNFRIRFGQGKLPGNMERVISSGNLSLVDRSILNSKFTIDRSFGIQFRNQFNLGKVFLSRQIIAISPGEGRNVTTGNIGGHQYTYRIELLPFGLFDSKGDYFGLDLKRELSPKLMLASSLDINKNAVKTRSNMGSYMILENGFFKTDIQTIFVDAHFKFRGFSLMYEYAKRTADDPIAKDSNNNPTGDIVNVGSSNNIQFSYLTNSNFAFTLRNTYINYDKIYQYNDNKQFTLGISKLFRGHKLKIQSDLTFEEKYNSNKNLIYRVQLDIHF